MTQTALRSLTRSCNRAYRTNLCKKKKNLFLKCIFYVKYGDYKSVRTNARVNDRLDGQILSDVIILSVERLDIEKTGSPLLVESREGSSV